MTFLSLFTDAVYLQPYLWLILLRANIRADMRVLYAAGAAAVALLLWTGFGAPPFTNDLIICYVLMVVYAGWRNRRGVPIRAICLAFILVFVNSYLWEFPIHIADFATNLDYGIQATQLLHLPPLYFLLSGYRPMLSLAPRRTAVYRVLGLWVLVSGAMIYCTLNPAGPTFAVNYALRWISLLVLLSLIGLAPIKLISGQGMLGVTDAPNTPT